jgi:hypothetical protein
MIYHVTTLRIHCIGVVSQLERGWCSQSLVMATYVTMLLVMMMHG